MLPRARAINTLDGWQGHTYSASVIVAPGTQKGQQQRECTHKSHISVLVRLYEELRRVGRHVASQAHSAVVLVLIDTDLTTDKKKKKKLS